MLKQKSYDKRIALNAFFGRFNEYVPAAVCRLVGVANEGVGASLLT